VRFKEVEAATAEVVAEAVVEAEVTQPEAEADEDAELVEGLAPLDPADFDFELSDEAIEELGEKMVVGSATTAFNVAMVFDFNRPKSHLNKSGKLNPKAPVVKISKPDCDNLAKLILDRITRCGKIWRDDAQVVTLLISKRFVIGKSSVLMVIKEVEA
jgi:Holliday junction resolvase RusA-like endonuclease